MSLFTEKSIALTTFFRSYCTPLAEDMEMVKNVMSKFTGLARSKQHFWVLAIAASGREPNLDREEKEKWFKHTSQASLG